MSGGRKRAGSSPRFWETEQFRALRREQYARLAESGFHDLELHDRKGNPLGYLARNPDRLAGKSRSERERDVRRMVAHDAPYRAEYYRRARELARAAMDGRRPWWVSVGLALHARGDGYREIGRLLGKAKRTVGACVRRYREKALLAGLTSA